MEPTLSQAIILAGGRAERMRPHSNTMPKALMPLDGLALISRQLIYLYEQGVKHVVVSSGYLHRLISRHVGGGSPYGLTVRHAVDPEPLGTAGAVRFAHQALEDPDEPFLVMNGSVLTDLPIPGLFARHAAVRASATMALVRYTSERPVAIETDDGRIRALPKVQLMPYWTDSGLSVLQPYTVKMMPETGDLRSVFETVAAEGLLSAHHARDEVFWREMSTVGDLYSYPGATA